MLSDDVWIPRCGVPWQCRSLVEGCLQEPSNEPMLSVDGGDGGYGLTCDVQAAVAQLSVKERVEVLKYTIYRWVKRISLFLFTKVNPFLDVFGI